MSEFEQLFNFALYVYNDAKKTAEHLQRHPNLKMNIKTKRNLSIFKSLLHNYLQY